jgi:DNA-binding transcriptional ArsR family regulator
MHAFDILGDPVRRRILELLADGEQSAGAITAIIHADFGITQPAVSQHLRVLRESGFLTVRAVGARRLYAVAAAPLWEVAAWLERFHGSWSQRLDALATELARGKRARPGAHIADSAGASAPTVDDNDKETT